MGDTPESRRHEHGDKAGGYEVARRKSFDDVFEVLVGHSASTRTDDFIRGSARQLDASVWRAASFPGCQSLLTPCRIVLDAVDRLPGQTDLPGDIRDADALQGQHVLGLGHLLSGVRGLPAEVGSFG